MAYRSRKRTTRAAPRRNSGRTNSRSYTRAAAPRRKRRVSRSSGSRTIRIVVQTVGATQQTDKSSKQPLRAMF